ncbi:carboxymuconolactone decarboxylase family protein [Streptomyces cinnamoneus]|uniref:carboxymuconolactone decarboxylase family protein n=1 Tax=Streptomyces cinnamoneus TaxID=53446 RepID=UPI001EFE7893|nr:carboxymuconolactone decarboxylase family protein [Streptomyces cinnamoneus]
MPGDSPAASAVPGFPAAATATPGTPAPGAAPVPFAAAGAPVSSVGTAPDPATAAAPVGEGTEPHPGFGPPVGGNPYAGTASGSPVFGGTTTPGVPGALPPDHADHAGGTDTTDPAGRPDHTGRTGPTDALAAGARLRREVLGDAAPAASGGHRAFTADFEDFATRVAWGDTWARPGLDRRARFLVALTALTVGGHLDELAEHTRAALRGGVTPGEIKETLLQCSLHCGLPAARAAFAVAGRVVAEERDARDGHDPQT